jgi:hypothetical protein
VNDQSQLLEIELPQGEPQAHAGEWVPLTLLLKRPPSSAASAQIKWIFCADREVQFDTDLFQGDVEVRPGEAYRLTIPIRVAIPKTLDLNAIGLQVGTAGENDRLESLPSRLLSIQPAIGKEIKVQVEALCSYAQGIKVQLTFTHEGTTRFDDLTITLGPERALAAGKGLIKRPAFGPGDKEQVEVVVAADCLEIDLAAEVNGRRAAVRLSRPIPRLAGRLERRFRFLEPRRLSLDQRAVYEEGSQRPVDPVRAAYPLYGGQRYEIVIVPQLPDVTEVKLRDIPGTIHVLKVEEESGRRVWKFLVDVSTKGRFSKPERLFYDVIAKGERLTGEVHLQLMPPRRSHLALAATLGIAISAQGIGALARFVLKPEFSLEEALAHFHFASDYQVLFLFSIPAAWGFLVLYDWLQYRVGS